MNKKLMEIGGARGIGLALSKACLEAGAVVVVTDILQQPDAGFTRAQNQTPDHLFYYPYVLINLRKRIEQYHCDLTKEEELNQTFDQISHRFRRVDGM